MVPRGVCGGILHFVHQQAIAGARLYNDDTLQQLLDKLDVIECFRDPGHGLLVGEMLEKPRDHFLSLGLNYCHCYDLARILVVKGSTVDIKCTQACSPQ